MQLNISDIYQKLNLHTIKWSNCYISNKSLVNTQFKCQTVLWFIDRILSGATTPGLSGSESDGNEVVLCLSQRSSITRTLLSSYLML